MLLCVLTCDRKFEAYLTYVLIYMHVKVLKMENHWTVSPLWKKEFSRGQERAWNKNTFYFILVYGGNKIYWDEPNNTVSFC